MLRKINWGRVRLPIKFIAHGVLVLAWSGAVPAFADEPCGKNLINKDQQALEIATEVSAQVADEIERITLPTQMFPGNKKGYAILIGTMVGSAALTSYLIAQLPGHLQFTSIFLAQLSTLGVYVMGAPIWEPMSSRFRQWAFGVRKEVLPTAMTPNTSLEALWVKSQENYSLNAQMSRNLVSQFTFVTKQNFFHAYRAHVEKNPAYAADQIAEAAYRMRILFKEVPPEDPSVTAAVRSAFTHHVEVDPGFIALVELKIKALDSEFDLPDVRPHYDRVLEHWLGKMQTRHETREEK